MKKYKKFFVFCGVKDMGDEPIKILSGKATLKRLEKTSCSWIDSTGEKITLEFSQAYEIERDNYNEGLQDCEYLIHCRKFVDLDFMDNKTLKTFFDDNNTGYRLKKFEDGQKFLYSYEDVPTFDSDDRVWDSIDEFGIFFDDEGIHMINCRHGYKIPRIKIYLNLQKADKDFLRWLIYIGCKSEKFPQTF